MATKKEWKVATLDPLKIQLDVKNPRIEVKSTASQATIREKLLDTEDVLGLARGIDKNGGLFYGERIITTLEGKKQIVLEGNRRVAVCQMLLDPSLVPREFRTRFPVASPDLKAKLSKLMADVAPTRLEAEPILTKRHTEQNAKPWTPVAKMRRAARLIDEGMDFDQAANVLGSTATNVKKLIRPYRLLKYAIELGGWTRDELEKLEDEKLVVTPYTRLFTLKATKDILKVSFDKHENIKSELPDEKFKSEMRKVVRDFLLPDPENKGRPRMDTRTDPEVYFAHLRASGKAAAAQNGPNKRPASAAAKPSATRPTTPKASVFFENLECHVQDDNLIKLKDEIKQINHERMTIAATLLTRALFESALVYKVKKDKLWSNLVATMKPGQDPGLKDLIKFCSNKKNNVFVETRICDILASQQTASAKDYLDSMVHMKYRQADVATLLSAANNLRAVIKHILEGN